MMRYSKAKGRGGAQSANERTQRNCNIHSALLAATGHWKEIFKTVGIAETFLHDRHGPCPICNGKDRFRLDDKDGRGTFYCNQCQPHAGDGFDLLRKFTGWSTKEALDYINNYMQVSPGPKNIRTFTQPIAVQVLKSGADELKKIANALEAEVRRHQRQAINAPADHQYLVNKGIELKNLKAVGDYLLIPIYSEKYRLISYQRIWPDGSKKFLKGTKKGGVYGIVGRDQAGQPIIICESFSTASSIYISLGVACWISFGHQGFEGAIRSIFENFEHSGELIIACDNDASGVSLNSAKKAISALQAMGYLLGVQIRIVMPIQVGTDFNDLYLSEGAEAVRAVFKDDK